MNLKRLFLYLLVGSVSLSALVAIGVILFGNFGNIEVRIVFTTLTVTVTSIFGAFNTELTEEDFLCVLRELCVGKSPAVTIFTNFACSTLPAATTTMFDARNIFL